MPKKRKRKKQDIISLLTRLFDLLARVIELGMFLRSFIFK